MHHVLILYVITYASLSCIVIESFNHSVSYKLNIMYQEDYNEREIYESRPFYQNIDIILSVFFSSTKDM